MARYKTRTFTEGELEFMQVLWTKGESTPDDIQESLHKKGRIITGGTVRNVLATLVEKGYVTRKKLGKAFQYKAKVGEDQAKRSMIQDLLKRAFGGSEGHMIATLLNNREVRKEEIDEIKRLISDKEKEE